jgi:hypothetical protein
MAKESLDMADTLNELQSSYDHVYPHLTVFQQTTSRVTR